MVKIMEGVEGCLVCASFNVLKSWSIRIKEESIKLKGMVDRFNWKHCRRAFSSIWNYAN